MGKLQGGALIDRLLFTAMLVGALLAAFGALRYVDLSNQLAANPAAQLHSSGDEVKVETTNEGFGLMSADIERRRIVEEQYHMMVAGGLGLALLGLGWLGNDLVRSRRGKASNPPQSPH